MSGWKTKTAAILGAVYAVVGIAIHYIGGPEAVGAITPLVGIPIIIGAFGFFGLRDAITKVLNGLK